jgi:hypothetical protein
MEEHRTSDRNELSAQSLSGDSQGAVIDRRANKAERDRLVAKMKRWLADPGNVGVAHDDFLKLMEAGSAVSSLALRSARRLPGQ